MLPGGAGMLAAILIGARLLAPLLEEHPVGNHAVFAGLIVASLVVPIRMVGARWRTREIGLALLAAAITFALTGLPLAGEIDPPLLLVAVAGAFAVCAVVLPGVSGSFLLLTVGMWRRPSRPSTTATLATSERPSSAPCSGWASSCRGCNGCSRTVTG